MERKDCSKAECNSIRRPSRCVVRGRHVIPLRHNSYYRRERARQKALGSINTLLVFERKWDCAKTSTRKVGSHLPDRSRRRIDRWRGNEEYFHLVSANIDPLVEKAAGKVRREQRALLLAEYVCIFLLCRNQDGRLASITRAKSQRLRSGLAGTSF